VVGRVSGTGASVCPDSVRSAPVTQSCLRCEREGSAQAAGMAVVRVTCLLVCRMENLFINRFMHMFQSSWSDFADFEKIFVKISNTISGECALGTLIVLGKKDAIFLSKTSWEIGQGCPTPLQLRSFTAQASPPRHSGQPPPSPRPTPPPNTCQWSHL
jgi:hypothetical protein